MEDTTISNWSVTTLTKFIRELFERQPPTYLPTLDTDSLRVHGPATFDDKVTFFGQKFASVGGTGAPAFQNGWVNWGAPNAAAAYVKSPDGWVRLHGLVKNAANPLALPSIIFTLPPGFRPEATCVFTSIGLNALARIDIDSAGNVSAVAPTANTAPWVTFETITFKATS